MRRAKEEYGIVLDFLPNGYPLGKRIPIAQIIGDKYFTLLEVAIKRGVNLMPAERVYIGPEKREKVHHIIGKLSFDKLTSTAKMELPKVVEDLVEKREAALVNFFNKATAITTRLHMLELLPGVGKKHMWDILKEREKEPFKSFEDIRKRVPLMPDPKKVIVKRILEELEGKDKYRIFVGVSWED